MRAVLVLVLERSIGHSIQNVRDGVATTFPQICADRINSLLYLLNFFADLLRITAIARHTRSPWGQASLRRRQARGTLWKREQTRQRVSCFLMGEYRPANISNPRMSLTCPQLERHTSHYGQWWQIRTPVKVER